MEKGGELGIGTGERESLGGGDVRFRLREINTGGARR